MFMNDFCGYFWVRIGEIREIYTLKVQGCVTKKQFPGVIEYKPLLKQWDLQQTHFNKVALGL